MDDIQADGILADLIRRIRACPLSIEELAERSGVPLGTLNKIVHGYTRDPRISNFEKLANCLDEVERIAS